MLSSASSSSSSPTSGALLAPGFRFHPTDEELVSYYLKRKVCGKPLRFDAISEIDIYRSEPWDLPSQSRLKTRDLEWYFFSSLDKKHGNGCRTNRATEQGYWKTTGKDRPIRRYSRTVGMKKTLVFHIGRAPRGERTNWVMHEYRLEDPELEQAGIPQGLIVLCRVFQKSGSGPKNGEQYGAPFVEEEWDDDALIPKKESTGHGNTDTVSDVGEWGYVQMNDDEQNLDMGIQYDDAALVLGFNDCDGDNNLMNHATDSEGIDEQKFLNDTCEDASFPELYVEDFFDGMVENCNLQEEHPNQYFCNMNENTNLTESDKNFPLTKEENSVESKDISSVGADNRTGEIGDDGMIYFDASAHDQLPIEDGLFIEMDDLLNCDEARASGFEILDDLLEYFDATSDNLHHVSLDSSSDLSEMVGSISNPLIPTPEVSTGIVEASMECPQALKVPDMEESSSSPPVQEPEASCGLKDKVTENSVVYDTNGSEFPYGPTWDESLEKHFRGMLESITAPPAFAVEYAEGSTKSTGHNATASTSVHVNAGMFLVGELRVTDGGKHRFSQKGGDVGFHLSSGMGRSPMASKHVNSYGFQILLTGTSASAISVMWQAGLYLGILWVVIFGVSFKVCDYIHAR